MLTPGTTQQDLHQLLDPVREMVAACMQCGTCSASCPNVQSMDWPPRMMWRALLMRLDDELLHSHTFWLCSSCYTCTLRCPRGLPLTDAIAALKRVAINFGDDYGRKQGAFYRIFSENVKKYGRVQEGALMSSYVLAEKSPLLAMSYAPLGLKLLGKGKIHPVTRAMSGVLDNLFQTTSQGEKP